MEWRCGVCAWREGEAWRDGDAWREEEREEWRLEGQPFSREFHFRFSALSSALPPCPCPCAWLGQGP